jgi:hypothetical protein
MRDRFERRRIKIEGQYARHPWAAAGASVFFALLAVWELTYGLHFHFVWAPVLFVALVALSALLGQIWLRSRRPGVRRVTSG